MPEPGSATSKAKRESLAPQFVVRDVVEAAEYYRDTFGFRILGYWQDPPCYAIVARDSVRIHFGDLTKGDVAPNSVRRPGGLDAYIWTDNVDTLFEELRGRGAKIVEQPCRQEYGTYEMVVEDKFGFRLAFGMNAPEK